MEGQSSVRASFEDTLHWSALNMMPNIGIRSRSKQQIGASWNIRQFMRARLNGPQKHRHVHWPHQQPLPFREISNQQKSVIRPVDYSRCSRIFDTCPLISGLWHGDQNLPSSLMLAHWRECSWNIGLEPERCHRIRIQCGAEAGFSNGTNVLGPRLVDNTSPTLLQSRPMVKKSFDERSEYFMVRSKRL